MTWWGPDGTEIETENAWRALVTNENFKLRERMTETLARGRLMVRTRYVGESEFMYRTTLLDLPTRAGQDVVWGAWDWHRRGMRIAHPLVVREARALDWPREKDLTRWRADLDAAVSRLGRVAVDMAMLEGRG
jgi:hypothetical protein